LIALVWQLSMVPCVQLLGLETRRHLPVLVKALGMPAAEQARSHGS
jgi:hypothetical protein